MSEKNNRPKHEINVTGGIYVGPRAKLEIGDGADVKVNAQNIIIDGVVKLIKNLSKPKNLFWKIIDGLIVILASTIFWFIQIFVLEKYF